MTTSNERARAVFQVVRTAISRLAAAKTHEDIDDALTECCRVVEAVCRQIGLFTNGDNSKCLDTTTADLADKDIRECFIDSFYVLLVGLLLQVAEKLQQRDASTALLMLVVCPPVATSPSKCIVLALQALMDALGPSGIRMYSTNTLHFIESAVVKHIEQLDISKLIDGIFDSIKDNSDGNSDGNDDGLTSIDMQLIQWRLFAQSLARLPDRASNAFAGKAASALSHSNFYRPLLDSALSALGRADAQQLSDTGPAVTAVLSTLIRTGQSSVIIERISDCISDATNDVIIARLSDVVSGLASEEQINIARALFKYIQQHAYRLSASHLQSLFTAMLSKWSVANADSLQNNSDHNHLATKRMVELALIDTVLPADTVRQYVIFIGGIEQADVNQPVSNNNNNSVLADVFRTLLRTWSSPTLLARVTMDKLLSLAQSLCIVMAALQHLQIDPKSLFPRTAIALNMTNIESFIDAPTEAVRLTGHALCEQLTKFLEPTGPKLDFELNRSDPSGIVVQIDRLCDPALLFNYGALAASRRSSIDSSTTLVDPTVSVPSAPPSTVGLNDSDSDADTSDDNDNSDDDDDELQPFGTTSSSGIGHRPRIMREAVVVTPSARDSGATDRYRRIRSPGYISECLDYMKDPEADWVKAGLGLKAIERLIRLGDERAIGEQALEILDRLMIMSASGAFVDDADKLSVTAISTLIAKVPYKVAPAVVNEMFFSVRRYGLTEKMIMLACVSAAARKMTGQDAGAFSSPNTVITSGQQRNLIQEVEHSEQQQLHSSTLHQPVRPANGIGRGTVIRTSRRLELQRQQQLRQQQPSGYMVHSGSSGSGVLLTLSSTSASAVARKTPGDAVCECLLGPLVHGGSSPEIGQYNVCDEPTILERYVATLGVLLDAGRLSANFPALAREAWSLCLDLRVVLSKNRSKPSGITLAASVDSQRRGPLITVVGESSTNKPIMPPASKPKIGDLLQLQRTSWQTLDSVAMSSVTLAIWRTIHIIVSALYSMSSTNSLMGKHYGRLVIDTINWAKECLDAPTDQVLQVVVANVWEILNKVMKAEHSSLLGSLGD
ncbi:hypothetical protein GQ42DRAFT_160659 [Ramicandelaber brevisporus]|nr:hypothetical protein GQ42DRAFT_160659 [Ramicandelaber brevisporus]